METLGNLIDKLTIANLRIWMAAASALHRFGRNL